MFYNFKIGLIVTCLFFAPYGVKAQSSAAKTDVIKREVTVVQTEKVGAEPANTIQYRDFQFVYSVVKSLGGNQKMREELFQSDYGLLVETTDEIQKVYTDKVYAESNGVFKDKFFFLAYLFFAAEPALTEDRQIIDLQFSLDKSYEAILRIVERYGWSIDVISPNGQTTRYAKGNMDKVPRFDGSKKILNYRGTNATKVFAQELPPLIDSLLKTGSVPEDIKKLLEVLRTNANAVIQSNGTSDGHADIDAKGQILIDQFDKMDEELNAYRKVLRRTESDAAIVTGTPPPEQRPVPALAILTNIQTIVGSMKEVKNYGNRYNRK